MSGRVAAFLKVRPDERRLAARLLAMMVVTWSGFAVGANAVESLLFVRFGPRALPVLFMVLGVVTFAVMLGVNVVLGRARRPRRAFLLAPLVMATVVVAMRAALLVPARWVYPVLWLVMMVLWTLEVVASWGVCATVHDTRQAKRLFPLYACGFITGTAIGGLVTGPLAAWIGAENLLLVWAAALFGRFVVTRSALGAAGATAEAPRRHRRAEGVRAWLSSLRASPLLRWMAVSIALFAVLHYSLAFLFASAATARFPEAGRLAGFLGLFMAVTSATALAASLFVANRLFALAGVVAAVVALAGVYAAGFAVLTVGMTFVAVVLFRFVQMVWFAGVWGSAWQALFNVVPAERRERTRAAMDGIALQAGVILAGAVLLLADRVLDPRAVAIIGLGAALLAVATTWRVRRSYAAAVVAALRVGNPEVFVAEAEPFGGMRRDAVARAAVLEGIDDGDGAVRRAAIEVLAEIAEPEDGPLLERGLGDDDPSVRRAAVRGLARIGRTRDLTPLLRDPADSVRLAAVDAAGRGDGADLAPLLTDPAATVRARAAALLLRSDHAAEAQDVLASLVTHPSTEARLAAVRAGASSPDCAMVLIEALGDHDPLVRGEAVAAVAALGKASRASLLRAVRRPELEAGAIQALARLDGGDTELVRAFVDRELAAAERDSRRRFAVAGTSDRADLLAYALRHRSLDRAVAALQAGCRYWDPSAIRLALENLVSRDPLQQANAMETIEAVGDRRRIRPLLSAWEEERGGVVDPFEALTELLADPDPTMRAFAAFAAGDVPSLRDAVGRLAGGDADTLVRETAAVAVEDRGVEALASLSLMERISFLRRVPLFADLVPEDLKHVAEAATEHVFEDGQPLAEQDEPGEEMFIIASGEIRVVVRREDGEPMEVARRPAGEAVGEMAIISRAPRMGSLIAAGTVRALVLDRRRFERILRERPEVSLAVMAVLSDRLRESYAAPETTP
ncbi:MAG TPA: HEAT repeat domain-containing protein [Actinomycetota bacterium]|nr:HEAT repeat domain-containing protein [Actinomycetota bacterium]